MSQTQVLCHLFLKVTMNIKPKDNIYEVWKGQVGKTWYLPNSERLIPALEPQRLERYIIVSQAGLGRDQLTLHLTTHYTRTQTRLEIVMGLPAGRQGSP